MKKPSISIFTTKWGHLSIAQSAQQALENAGYQTHLELSDIAANQLYSPFYLYFPSLFKIPHKLSDKKQVQQILSKLVQSTYEKRISDRLVKECPDIVVSSYFLDNMILEKLQDKFEYKLLNLVSNPRSISSMATVQKGINFVFDDQAVDICKDFGIPKKNVIKSGWFVRQQFKPVKDKPNIRKDLGLPPNQLTFLVAAGSEGTNTVLKILPSLLTINRPLTVVFSCGHNKSLFRLVQLTQKAQQASRQNSATVLKPISYTTELDQYIKAADLVIGKAGPNLLFETIACHVPFFAITHISGQEDGNLDIIKDYQLGIVQENMLKATKQLRSLIQDPKKLDQYAPHLKEMAKYNQQAGTILTDFIRQLN